MGAWFPVFRWPVESAAEQAAGPIRDSGLLLCCGNSTAKGQGQDARRGLKKMLHCSSPTVQDSPGILKLTDILQHENGSLVLASVALYAQIFTCPVCPFVSPVKSIDLCHDSLRFRHLQYAQPLDPAVPDHRSHENTTAKAGYCLVQGK